MTTPTQLPLFFDGKTYDKPIPPGTGREANRRDV